MRCSSSNLTKSVRVQGKFRDLLPSICIGPLLILLVCLLITGRNGGNLSGYVWNSDVRAKKINTPFNVHVRYAYIYIFQNWFIFVKQITYNDTRIMLVIVFFSKIIETIKLKNRYKNKLPNEKTFALPTSHPANLQTSV